MVTWRCCFGPMVVAQLLVAGTHVSQVFTPVHSKEQAEVYDPYLYLLVDSLTGIVSYLQFLQVFLVFI